MKLRGGIAGVWLLAVLLSACSESTVSGSHTTSSTSPIPTTAQSTTSSAAPTTTTSPTTTTVPETTTTSTIPVVVGLDLSADGLGGESFGADANGVIAYVRSILDNPTHDTGWFDPVASGAACPGTEVRHVTWHDLSLFFTNETTGLRHFAAYTYGPPSGEFIDPFGLSVAGGITIGSTVDELLAVYPDALVNPADELGDASFHIVDGLSGFLTGTSGSDTITTFIGGFGCGE